MVDIIPCRGLHPSWIGMCPSALPRIPCVPFRPGLKGKPAPDRPDSWPARHGRNYGLHGALRGGVRDHGEYVARPGPFFHLTGCIRNTRARKHPADIERGYRGRFSRGGDPAGAFTIPEFVRVRFFFGILVLPCNAASIVVLLALSSSPSGFMVNFINFIVFGIGMALPLLIISIVSMQKSRTLIAILTTHKRVVNVTAGVLMLAVSLYYLFFTGMLPIPP